MKKNVLMVITICLFFGQLAAQELDPSMIKPLLSESFKQTFDNQKTLTMIILQLLKMTNFTLVNLLKFI